MSYIKRYLENISVEMGLQGEITEAVLESAKQLQQAKELVEQKVTAIAVTQDGQFIVFDDEGDLPPLKYIVDGYGYYFHFQENRWKYTKHPQAISCKGDGLFNSIPVVAPPTN